MELPLEVDKLYQRLLAYNEQTYFVGGCVRDYLLGLETKDFDICMNADIAEVKSYLNKKNYRIFNLGEKYGTITVVLPFYHVEITSFRAETGYQDHRHPTITRAYSLEEDLRRRDFTINAICYHREKGIIDLFHGQDAIAQKQIVAVGNPLDRFEEDALRIMRAIRFAARLNFVIEEKTIEAIRIKRWLLKEISRERVITELSSILSGKNAKEGIKLLINTGIFEVLFPLFDLSRLSLDKYIHIEDEENKNFLLAVNMMQLFGRRYSKDEIIQVVKDIHPSPSFVRDIRLIMQANNILDIGLTRTNLKKIMQLIPSESLKTYISYYAANSTYDFDFTNTIETIIEIVFTNEPYLLNSVAIDGFILKDLGLKKRQIGDMKMWLFEQVLNNPKLNDEATLLKMAEERVSEIKRNRSKPRRTKRDTIK